ncbi:hypothetical protein [Methylobacterium adhaesivum]|uniref:Uncharacterized protein n=1 Tax=Methylobacterium adhaesivum TaxID=333297 RepID=A0ABT8BIH2_9HYPH|nr:hypothetical protein [Methylobacterium adhaesivum]MDN3591045.1 hypothetical protein [Methylobacterium adhaesivum]
MTPWDRSMAESFAEVSSEVRRKFLKIMSGRIPQSLFVGNEAADFSPGEDPVRALLFPKHS